MGFVGAPLALQKQLDFTVECKGLEDVVLVGSTKNLKRILGNLVANAINYTTSGSVKLTAYPMKRDAATPGNSEVVVRFAVTDTGKGISKNEQDELWVPYTRGGTANTPLLAYGSLRLLPLLLLDRPSEFPL